MRSLPFRACWLSFVLSLAVLCLSAGGRGQEDIPVPNHTRWTVLQFARYWTHFDVIPLVVNRMSGNPDKHPPTEDELKPELFLVQSNVSSTVTKVGDNYEVVVLIEQTPPGLKYARIPEAGAGRYTAKDWLKLNAYGSKYTLADVTNQGKTAYVTPEHTDEFNLLDDDNGSHKTRDNHVAFAAGDPVYEGGTVGVIINGRDYRVLYFIAAAVGGVLLGFIGRGLIGKRQG